MKITPLIYLLPSATFAYHCESDELFGGPHGGQRLGRRTFSSYYPLPPPQYSADRHRGEARRRATPEELG